MNQYLKLYLLVAIVCASFHMAFAQSVNLPADDRKEAYSDVGVQEAIDFMINRLPKLITENKAQALDEFDRYADALNSLDENDVLFMVGHLYAVTDQAKEAIATFGQLIDDPRLGEDSRRMLNLLLYYRAVYYLQNEDRQATQSFLQDILEQFPTGKYYPVYLYLWADLVSESDNQDQITRFIDNYNNDRLWLEQTFKPSKQDLIQRINNLDLNSYFQDPSEMNYLVLDKDISQIQDELQTLYNQMQSRLGLMTAESVARISEEETRLLEDVRSSLKLYRNPPELNLETLARVDTLDAGSAAYRDYQLGALILEQLKGTAEYYGDVLDIMDRFFENKYELFTSEDPAVANTNYSDLELKRLFDIEKNIYVYTDLISAIDAVMADPNYLSLNTDLRPQRQEYQEKLTDLQQRKQRYLSVRVHEQDSEEALFTEFLEEYYALTREKRLFDEVIPDAESVMYSLIRENYPKRLKNTMLQQRTLAGATAASNISVGDDMTSFITNLDFIYLQMDYRKLRYEEQTAKARVSTLNEEELQSQYAYLQERKRNLLRDHQDFLSRNSQIDQLEQPSGGFLLNNAIIYYNMAELQYAVDLDKPELALDYYRRVLEIDPDFFLKDYALYNIAYTSSELKKDRLDVAISEFRASNSSGGRPQNLKYRAEDFSEAIQAYSALAFDPEFADSPMREEALYRLGVLNFVIGSDADKPVDYYAQARQCFDTLYSNTDSSYRWEALYQRAWVNMNQGDEQSLDLALQDFITLIAAVDDGQIKDPYLAEDYKSNAVDNIAYTLVAMDGVEFNQVARGVAKIETALANFEDREMVNRVIDKATEHKTGMQATQQAIDYLELRLRNAPLDLHNPSIVDSIVVLYHTPGLVLRPGQDLAAIKTGKDEFVVSSYSNSSDWYRRNVANADPSQAELARQLTVIRNAYENIRIRKYNDLVSTVSDQAYRDYNSHLAEFASYRELFGDTYAQWQAANEKSNTLIKTILAEKRNTNLDKFAAYQSLRQYNDAYPPQVNPDYLNNEGLAYKYAKDIFQDLEIRYSTAGFVPEPGLPSNQKDLYGFFRDASLRFNNVLGMSEFSSDLQKSNSAQVMMYLAEIELSMNMPELAKSRYTEVLTYKNELDKTTLLSIYLNLAEIYESEKQFAQSEENYREAIKYAANPADANAIDQLVKLQIQNSYQLAEQQGDFELAGDRYLLMSQEYKADQEKYFGYRYQASEAYKKARRYQEALDLKLELAKSKTAIQDVYYLYYEAWTIAETNMVNKAYAQRLKNEFVALYPASNYAFNIRVEEIEALRGNQAQKPEAARMYLALHDEVRAGKIDSGDVTPEEIYLWAVSVYQEIDDKDRIVELLDYFTKTYPNNPKNNDFLMILADEYLARGDFSKFENYARQLYLRDNTKSDRYQFTANRKLGDIAAEFDAAFTAGNWDLAFRKRDEFKNIETVYAREGLTLDNSQAYKAFAFAEQQYKEMQIRQQYLAEFDKQISAVEKGKFLTATPNSMVPVGKTTTWNNHLFGGKYNYVPNLQDYVDSDYRKVMSVLDRDNADILDNPRRLRALMVIGKLNEHAADIIEGQIIRYFNITNEMATHRTTLTDGSMQYDSVITGQLQPYAAQFVESYRTTSNDIYLNIFDNYITAGYRDQYTDLAESILQQRNLLPVYELKNEPLTKDWDVTLKLPEGGTTKLKSGINEVTTPKGLSLGSLTIPAGHALLVNKQLELEQVPQYVFLNIAYPFDPVISINGEPLSPVFTPIDTLGTQTGKRVHYAIRVDGSYWKQGQNEIKGEFANVGEEPVAFDFGATLVYPAQIQMAAAAVPSQKYVTNGDWVAVMVNAESGSELRSYALVSESFDLDIVDTSEYLSNPSVKPIWINEAGTDLVPQVTFEYEFEIASEGGEVNLDFVAPDRATIILNDQVLLENYPVDYDVDPFVLYPRRIAIPTDILVAGTNKIQFQISNMSPNRGLMAEISILNPDKE